MDRKYAKLFATGAALALATTAFGTAAVAQDEEMSDKPMYKIGVTNTLVGNGWREEMICSIKAEALASGRVDELVIAHRNTDAAGQLGDIRDLIEADVDAILINPVDPDSPLPAVEEAIAAGIPVIAIDMGVNSEDAYLFANSHEEYGYMGAKWLFEQLGGEGAVVYMRGISGALADTLRDQGVQRAKEEYPGIEFVSQTFTGWDQPTGVQQINDYFATFGPLDGVWTSGIDNVIVTAFETAGVPFVPIVGADNAEYSEFLVTKDDLVGAAVTNSAAVGGAGVTLATQILDGEWDESQKEVILDPVLWDNTTEEGRETITAALDPDLNPLFPLTYQLPPWTTYTRDEFLACKGPGE